MLRITAAVALLCLPFGVAIGQSIEAEFHVARVIYSSGQGERTWRPWWAIDYPEAEYHLTNGLRRLTTASVADDSIHLRLTDPEIFDYPWLFIQQVGHWRLSRQEISALREFVKRGGFVVLDDFHGNYEWQVVRDTLTHAFPEWPIVPLPGDHELMQIFYGLDQETQIPGKRHLYRGASGQFEAQLRGPARWYGISDDAGRLVVAINFNMDMGDAWEHADDPYYPLPMTSLAYRFAVNYVIYAMTH
ncbi:MAG: DUF4159 domain-containing protein [Woeseiaceae bacterium]